MAVVRSVRFTLALGCVAVVGGALVFAPGVSRRSPQPLVEHQVDAVSAYGRLPLAFEPAAGRSGFVARTGRSALFLEAGQVVFSVPRALVRMELVGGRAQARLRASQRLPGTVNEFFGQDPARWRTGIPTFARLTAADVYPGIGLAYHGDRGRFEYDFLLSAGADADAIALRFQGQRSLRLDRAGGLLLALPDGILRQAPPLAYQQVAGRKREVTSRFVLRRDGAVGFSLGRYDRSLPLLIDPSISYSTYLGGSGADVGFGVSVDTGGNAYVTGQTASTDFPTANAVQAANGGGSDVFVAKLNPTGNALVYATYLGGAADDLGQGIAVDGSGNAYVTGYTSSSNFPTANPIQAGYANAIDAFVTKLNPAGNALVYSTYLGGSGTDLGYGVAVDTSGNAYLTGQAGSTNFPTANAIQAMNGGGNDAFLTKVNTAGNALAYSTYLGGGDGDLGYGVAVDTSGNAYVTGQTASTNFPTANALQTAYATAIDGFVTKVNAAGNALVYSSYLGGSGTDVGQAVAVDGTGQAYPTGQTSSTDFPTANAIQAANGGGSYDAFASKLNAAGSAFVYSTYLGGSGSDIGYGVAADTSGSAYLAGQTDSTNFPTASPFQAANGGGIDAFVVNLNPGGTALVYSSYLGGNGGTDVGNALALDGSGNAYLTGQTNSTNFPTANPVQAANGGAGDAFVSRVVHAPSAVTVRSFKATRAGSGVTLRWRTAFEVSLLGFDVYRESGRDLVRVNRALIRAGAGSYALRDRLPPGVRSARYWLEEVRLDGSRARRGPVRVR